MPVSQCDQKSRVVALANRGAVLDESMQLPALSQLGLDGNTLLLPVGELDGAPCYACRVDPECFTTIAGRAILAGASEDVREAFCRAQEMLLWRESHRFCGKCAQPLIPSTHDLAMTCPACGAVYFPQIAPAVIVAITRNGGNEILLAHNHRFNEGVFSLIAGFVEMGENLEEAIHREIKEEIGIEVDHFRYLASQSWPFPNSLMLAFYAEWAGGEACADGAELSECHWYTRDQLPRLPEKGSVARAVIDAFVENRL